MGVQAVRCPTSPPRAYQHPIPIPTHTHAHKRSPVSLQRAPAAAASLRWWAPPATCCAAPACPTAQPYEATVCLWEGERRGCGSADAFSECARVHAGPLGTCTRSQDACRTSRRLHRQSQGGQHDVIAPCRWTQSARTPPRPPALAAAAAAPCPRTGRCPAPAQRTGKALRVLDCRA